VVDAPKGRAIKVHWPSFFAYFFVIALMDYKPFLEAFRHGLPPDDVAGLAGSLTASVVLAAVLGALTHVALARSRGSGSA
jgi:hypothetical protein